MHLRVTSAVVLVLGILSLAACGVRGPLELPPEQKAESTKAGPDGKQQHKGLILDGLLR